MNRGHSAFVIAAIAACTLPLTGCADQGKQIQTLQNQVTDLKAQADRVNRQLAEKTGQLEQADKQLATLNKLPPERWQVVPKPARMEIDAISGLRAGKPEVGSATTQPVDGPGSPVKVFARIYLVIRDSTGTPMRAAGPLTVSLFDLSADPPRVLGVYHFSPQQTARFYRPAVLSQPDMFGFDLPLNAAPKADRLTARVEFTDYLTGTTFVDEKSLTLLK